MERASKLWWILAGAGVVAAVVAGAYFNAPPPSSPEASTQSVAATAESQPETSPAPSVPDYLPEEESEALTAPVAHSEADTVPETKAPAPVSEPEQAAAPLLPAPAVADALASPIAPGLPQTRAGTLTPEMAPLLGESSAPLSLAQVLPPGEAPVPGQIAPSFDLVRVAPDGSAVIAGRAAPGANVQVFSGTIPIAEVVASARGEFVVFLDGPAEPTLDLRIPDAPEGAQLVVSQDDIIILPAAPDTPEASPIVLHRTPDKVQIVQPSGPAIPGNVSLDLLSYTTSGAVQLAGRGTPGHTARIYANDTLAGEALIAAGGNWELEIADIAQGRYMLRVDEVNREGKVTSRAESPFQRDFPEADMPESFSQGAKIIVQPGNTLWLMATEAYGDGDAFTQIFSANKDAIRDPDLIYPGQIFSIPRLEE